MGSVEEGILDGPRDLNVTFGVKRNASPKREQNLFLSETARARICDGLCKEIQIYKELLNRAINLAQDYITMSELQESCPLEASGTTCKRST
jgi:hypothetical protein